MNLHLEVPYYEVTSYNNGDVVSMRIVDDVIRAMDLAVSFCSTGELYSNHTALVCLYDGDELIEHWLFNGLEDPKHRVFV